jgi:uncharacterized protein DUF4082
MKKKILIAALFLVSLAVRHLAFSGGLPAQSSPQSKETGSTSQPTSGAHYYPTRDVQRNLEKLTLKTTTNLRYHDGPVITSAHVVFIFWGPSFNNTASPDYNYARTLQNFRNQFGNTPEYNTITQYYGDNGTVALTNLAGGPPDWFDTSTPPLNVTDLIAQGEINTYLAVHGLDANAIYEVVLPSTSFSSRPNGTSSCGGPVVAYCAYHGFYTSGGSVVKYSVEPYPSCSTCQVPGWSAEQNQEKLVTHETRETVTDPQLNAWYDDYNGYEADDKCDLSPPPFIGTGGYAYQYEWSNALSACTASTPLPVYEGYHEVANCRGISGWAWNQSTPNGAINVDIDRDYWQVATVPANLFRWDLYYAGKGNGYHAFVYTPDGSWKDGQWHSARVRFSGTGTNLYWSPISFICGVSMFPYLSPVYPDLSTGGQVYTVATQFSSSISGYISQLGFYRAPSESGTNTIRLWTDSGTQLASVTPYCWGGGWCWGGIPDVAINAGTVYRVTVNTNYAQAKTGCGIGGGITNQNLTAYQGFWQAGDTFPTIASCSNFFVDVKFDM